MNNITLLFERVIGLSGRLAQRGADDPTALSWTEDDRDACRDLARTLYELVACFESLCLTERTLHTGNEKALLGRYLRLMLATRHPEQAAYFNTCPEAFVVEETWKQQALLWKGGHDLHIRPEFWPFARRTGIAMGTALRELTESPKPKPVRHKLTLVQS